VEDIEHIALDVGAGNLGGQEIAAPGVVAQGKKGVTNTARHFAAHEYL
jgi:hypothetical protein